MRDARSRTLLRVVEAGYHPIRVPYFLRFMMIFSSHFFSLLRSVAVPT